MDLATDNQLVRLKDEDGNIILLAIKIGFLRTSISTPEPEWFTEMSRGPGEEYYQGNRGGIFVFRSTDSGNTWNHLTTIDIGTIQNGKYGYPW
jgi:hypothetical protein